MTGTLTRAQNHVSKLEAVIAEARSVQVDDTLSAASRDVELKVLSGRAISQMRALLALDPARSIRAAATQIAEGVPNQSRAIRLSQARIAEIGTSMRDFAEGLNREADRIAALVPSLPKQTSLSPAERLIQTIWRMPGLTMAAILLDACGFTAIAFRIAIYRALRIKLAEENDRPVLDYVPLDDFWRVEEFVTRADVAQRRVSGHVLWGAHGSGNDNRREAATPSHANEKSMVEKDRPHPAPRPSPDWAADVDGASFNARWEAERQRHTQSHSPHLQTGDKPMSDDQTPRRPEGTLREGALKAAIWRNEGENGAYHSVTVARTYKDQDGNLQDTNSFRPKDLLGLSELARRAHHDANELDRAVFKDRRQAQQDQAQTRTRGQSR